MNFLILVFLIEIDCPEVQSTEKPIVRYIHGINILCPKEGFEEYL